MGFRCLYVYSYCLTQRISERVMFEDCTAQLDLLIHAFQPTSSSNSYRNQVSKFIESTIQSRLQQTQIVGSGSYTSRTYLPESDIDLVLIPRNSNENEGKKDDEQESHEQVVNVTDSSQEMLSISTIIQSLCDAVTQRDAAKSAAHSTGPRGRGGSLGSFTIPSMPYSNMNIRYAPSLHRSIYISFSLQR